MFSVSPLSYLQHPFASIRFLQLHLVTRQPLSLYHLRIFLSYFHYITFL
nr:MAG TPA: hypothetical protein [Caudoviricetes sp.]